jgi:Tfp pilus assembly protein PilF
MLARSNPGCIALLLLLAGCASAPVEQRTDYLFQDKLFGPPSERISAEDVLAVSPEMRHYVRYEIAEQLAGKGRQKGLFDALYDKNQLKLDYDAAITRNAAQAFAARSGNCLSLVIMTAALAKEVGLQVSYQRVFTEDSWSRSGDLYFASGHINISLGRRVSDPRVLFAERNVLTIDFYPPRPGAVQHSWTVKEETVLAMFLNNRAAETLARGELNDAYWWARAAIERDPKFLASFNTLGVIYRRHGNVQDAERVLRHVLDREPENTDVLSNLVMVLEDQGRVAESKVLAQQLKELQPYPPFHFFNLGQEAMRAGNYRAARDYFAKEVARDAYYHEFHFWLAAAYLGLGDIKRAQTHLEIATENSSTRTLHDLYAAKLDRLNFELNHR